jgi:hypothetical protein
VLLRLCGQVVGMCLHLARSFSHLTSYTSQRTRQLGPLTSL